MEFDLFISHASEDKSTLVRPLAHQLRWRGFKVWYDEFELKLGDSLTERTDYGLSASEGGLVVLSPAFFQKKWPKRELAGITARQLHQNARLIPVWHGVDVDDVIAFSPPLADLKALSSTVGMDAMIAEIARAVPPSNPERSDTTIEAAMDFLDMGETRTAYWVACKALDDRLHSIVHSCVERGIISHNDKDQISDALSALRALLVRNLVTVEDEAGLINVWILLERYGEFDSFSIPPWQDEPQEHFFIHEVRRFLRANRLSPGGMGGMD